MIHKLKFHLAFEHSNKVLKGDHTFTKGLTAISGPNESGKSVCLEMIRYALFGVKALRAPASFYTKLSVTMTFNVGEDTFIVERDGSKVKLTRNNEDLASGTSVVNQAIKTILGYDLEVFDTANAVLQNQIEDLTNKTPAERKRMVDRTIGLDAINTVGKKLADDCSTLKKIAESLEEQIIPVEKPKKPKALTKSMETLRKELNELRETQKKVIEVKAMLKAKRVLKPNEPDSLETGNLTEEEIDKKISEITSELSKADRIPQLKALLYTGKETLEEVQKYINEDGEKQWTAYKEYNAQRVEDPTPFPLKDVAQAIELQKLESEYKFLISTIGDTAQCPKCSHEFTLGGDPEDKWSSDDFEFDSYGELLEKYKGMFSGYWNKLQVLYHNKMKFEQFEQLEVVPEPEVKDFGSMSRALEVKKAITLSKDAEKELKSLDPELLATKEKEKRQLLTWRKNKQILERAKETYEQEMLKYKQYLDLGREYSQFLDETKDIDDKIQSLEDTMASYEVYERALQSYKDTVERNNQVAKKVKETKQSLDETLLARKALNNLKPKVKLYLMPSLNRVASNLISQMTNGARNNIKVDENFEVMVDGQPVDTLSGSGKAVANLALRIGLGTVLTNKIFSVLLADEIDAAMDADRAAYTAKCLRNLTQTISQIILVSHQQPEADHHIQL